MSPTEIAFENLLKLPALKDWNFNQESILRYEFGVWGKHQGTSDDYALIASTNSFFMEDNDYEQKFYIGTTDKVEKSPTFMWKSIGSTVSAASICLSNRNDAKNRPSTQTIVIQSDITINQIPAPIQSLFLISMVENMQNTDHILNKLVGRDLDKETFTNSILNIDPDHHKDIILSKAKVIAAFKVGLEHIQSNYSQQQLITFYAHLLEGGSPALLAKHKQYPPEIVAVLLAFLPSTLANSFSFLENLPSSRKHPQQIEENWDAILSKDNWSKIAVTISTNVKIKSEEITQSLINFKFASNLQKDHLPQEIDTQATTISIKGKEDNINLTLWGPTSAGKTVFLAQLYLEGTRYENDWNIKILSSQSKAFMDDMRKDMRMYNKFPVSTQLGHTETIELAMINKKNGIKAQLIMQDRSGTYFTDLNDDILTTLNQADGLVLLFDPTRDSAKLEDEVWSTLETLQMQLDENHDKITKPIAVCLSKADHYIKDIESFDFAISDPDTFVRHYIEPKLIELLENFCENYTLFPVSSVGMKVERSHVDPVVFYDDQLQSRIIPDNAVQSINLLSPFIWLINNLKH